MKIYYNLTNQCRVDEDNCRLTGFPVVYYGTAPVWELQLFQGPLGTEPDVPDVSGMTAWRAAIDTDWTYGTEPMCRTVEGIDRSRAASGLLTIPLNANTITFANALNGKKSLNGFFELRGFTTQGAVESIILFGVTLHNAIDPEGGLSPETVSPDTITRAEVMACLRAPDERQYTSDPSDPSAAHTSQTGSDTHTRRRNSAAAGEWGPWEALVPGPQGSQGPQGSTPVLSGGSVTTLPAGASATAELVSSGGSTYILNLGIPQGPNGSLTMPIQPYSSDSAYPSMTCIAYNGGGYQVISGTTAGENPDNAASKFICFASKGTDGSDGSNGSNGSNGSDGVSPVVYATQTSSGVIIVTSDALGSATVEVLNGSDGVLASSYQVVSALVSGAVVFPDTMPPPVYVKTDLGTMYPVEKNSLVSSGGSWTIDPAPYLAYDGVSSFTSPWTVYFAGGDKGDKGDKGDMPVLSGGSVTTLPAGSSASAEIVSSGSAYTLNLGIPAGSSGVSPVVYATQTSSGAVIVTSDALGSSTVEILNGTNGTNGISPTCSVTQVSSGAVIVTSDTSGVSSATILHGRLEGASEVVSSLTSGAIVLESEAVPVYVRTSAGTLYPVEKGTISISSGSWYIDPAAYLAYDGVSSFAGPWTVYYAGGLPDFQYIHGGSSSIVPLEHQVYQISISSGASVTVDSSGLNSSVCMTAELWLDMPSSAVSFTLPAFTWIDGGAPLFSSGSTRYVITIRWNGSKFLANLAYTEALA